MFLFQITKYTAQRPLFQHFISSAGNQLHGKSSFIVLIKFNIKAKFLR